MDGSTILKSKITMVLLALCLSAVAFVTVELYMQKRDVDSEVAKLTAQSTKLSTDNKQLSELIKYMDTPEYKEREAREKLNLKRPGEEVVVLPDSDSSGMVAGASQDSESNPSKWFSYFFKH